MRTSDCLSPRVSIIVPNYNHASYLATRINSILAQTYRDWELIVLDDASTDNSLEILAGYEEDGRISLIRNETNSGNTFVQWNRGVQAARGEFVWIAESDDDSEPEFLETLIPLLHDGVILAYCQSAVIDASGRVVGTTLDWTEDLDPQRWKRPFVNEGMQEILQYLCMRNTIPNASGVVFRKSAYVKAGGAPQDFRLCGDWLTYARMVAQGSIAYTPLILNHFRTHGGSVRSTIVKASELSEHIGVVHAIAREFPVEKTRLQIGARQLGLRSLHFMQNSSVDPGFGWVWKTSRELEALGGYSTWHMLWRYVAVRAWRSPIPRCLLKLRRWMIEFFRLKARRT